MTVTQTGRFLSFEILPAYKNNRKLQKPDRLSKADVRLTHKQASIVTTRLISATFSMWFLLQT